ncbi:MAG: class I SAM-dependent methyltransferase [Nitrospirae bacterium]|nr:class I SAM-dependent methyltransferase [Nitrospirota bacterium]
MKASCPICNGLLDFRLIEDIKHEKMSYNVYFCKSCKVGTTVPIPSQEELSKLYSANYRSPEGRKFNPFIEFFIYFWRLLRKRRIKKYIKKGSILDVGCGRGLFLDIMRKDGWDVAGVEFDEATASYAKKVYDINVVSGDPEEWGFSSENFDVIIISHVLEHLHNPAQMIKECRRLLKKNGLFVCAIPNLASLQASAGKGAWFHLDIPYHIYHFSRDGLIRLLNINSFKIVGERQFDIEYNPFGWLQTLLNISGIKKNFFYNMLKSPELRKREISNVKGQDILLTIALLPFYLLLSFMLSAIESFALKRGGTIEIFAIKE